MVKRKQLPFGVYNVMLCLLVTAVFVLGVMCIQEAENRWYLKLDVSDDQVSKLSEYTLSRLEALEEDVTLHLVHRPGSSTLHDLQQETLLKMAAVCPRKMPGWPFCATPPLNCGQKKT